MNVLIVGAGAVGYNLAEQLSSEGHNISVVDTSGTQTRRVNEKVDALAVEGSGTTPSILEQARIKDSEMLVAVTDSDEVNMIACLLASHYGVRWKIARVRNPEISSGESILGPKELAVDFMINPDLATVDSIVRIVETPGALEVAVLADGEALLVGFGVPEDAPGAGRSIMEIRQTIDEFPIVVAISRGEEIFVPWGEDKIEAGDDIYCVLHRDTMPFFLPCLNRKADEVGKIIIYGASRTAIALAGRREDRKIIVTIIDPDEEKALVTASQLSKALVISGSATDRSILEEAHVEHADYFLALSDDDDSNLMAALLARKLGADKLMVMTSEHDYVPLLESIDIDAVINPRIVTFNEILHFIRRGIVQSVVRISDGRAEGVELIASKGQKDVGQPIKKIGEWMPKTSIIGTVLRSGQMMVPYGDLVIEQGDHVDVFGMPEAIPQVEKLFTEKRAWGG